MTDTEILQGMLEKMDELAKQMEEARQSDKISHRLVLEKLDELEQII